MIQIRSDNTVIKKKGKWPKKKKKKKNLVTSFICLTCISFAHWWHVYILKQSGGEEDREPEPEPEREYTPAGRALKAKL